MSTVPSRASCPAPSPWREHTAERLRNLASGDEFECYPLALKAGLGLASVAVLGGALSMVLAGDAVGSGPLSAVPIGVWAAGLVATEPFLWGLALRPLVIPRYRAGVYVAGILANLAFLTGFLLSFGHEHMSMLHFILLLGMLDAATDSMPINRAMPLAAASAMFSHADGLDLVLLGGIVLAGVLQESRISYGERLRARRLSGLLEEVARAKDDAHTDALTGLFTRRILEERIEGVFDLCLRQALPFSVLLIDLDHFKDVNDTYGHAAGDSVLRAAAEATLAQRRGDDVAIRYGGDEMLVITTSAEGYAQLAAFARRLGDSLASVETPGGFISASIGGYCSAGTPARNLQEALDLSDQALYEAKRQGRGRAVMVPDIGTEPHPGSRGRIWHGGYSMTGDGDGEQPRHGS